MSELTFTNVFWPPMGVLDEDSRGRSLGSAAVRDAVLRLGPRLVGCDHIHASGGQQALLGRSPVVNAGPAGVEWELVSGDRVVDMNGLYSRAGRAE